MRKITGLTSSSVFINTAIAGLLSVFSLSALASTETSDISSDLKDAASTAVDIEMIETIDAVDLKMVGTADMDLLWFSVYSAKLMSIDGQYQTKQFPLKLEIQYHRDIEAADLIEATVEQWQHIGIDESLIPLLQAQIEDAWPDVKEGDKLSFMMHEQSKGQFFFNDEALPMIFEPGFSEAFLGIWLSENTSRPELRQQLIGATND
ncbi:chalcone isomerase family protein [Shewanella donghaensis]|uniref:chalcone isomerase family protein n=1 Tax=Shewanella donghaensis TaxID=238836 RepID=UPI001184596E|nr:chalcone isomerase family protein [Shewanella donghaensis]